MKFHSWSHKLMINFFYSVYYFRRREKKNQKTKIKNVKSFWETFILKLYSK